MLMPNQLIKVKVIGKTLQHYKNLGYDVKCLDIIMVPPEHLTEGSHSNVDVMCDICGKLISRPYKRYLKCHTNGYDTCDQCKDKKAKDTCMERYGVETHMLVPEIQEKFKNIINLKYGVDNVSKLDIVKEKKIDTCIKNFGVSNPMLSDIIKNKLEETNIKKYGVKHPHQNPVIKSKAMQTMRENNSTPTSSQQIQIYQMIKSKYPKAELNYPFSTCSLDIFVCINDIKIDVEYDGSYWHQDKQRDIKRDKFLQSQGFKTLRIRSGHSIPTEQELFDAIDYLVNTEHHFKEIILSDWKEDDE